MAHINLKMGELFVGAGGLGVGFILANHPHIQFQPTFAVDNEPISLSTYKGNLEWLSAHKQDLDVSRSRVLLLDIDKIHGNDLISKSDLNNEELDILVGGPPCQGYSSSNRAGQKKNKDERNYLMRVFLDKVRDICPKMFLIENVQGVQWTEPTEGMRLDTLQLPLFPDIDHDVQLDSVQEFLVRQANSLGYKVWYKIIDAATFGIPQHRMRFFLFGVRADLIPNDEEVNLSEYLNDFVVDRYTTVSEAINDLPPLGNGDRYIGSYDPSSNSYVQKLRQYMLSNEVYDHFTTKHKDYVIDRYKQIQQGQNWEAIRGLMTNYANIDNTHSNIYRRLQNDLPAITITHYRKSMIIHPIQDRGLSFREACRLQSFPDWFRFQGGREAMQQQLANAVPPMLATKVAYAVAEYWYNTIRQ